MASLRKMRGKYYIRLRLAGKKEKLFPTLTGDERLARARLKEFEKDEWKVRAGLMAESELEDIKMGEAEKRFIAHCKNSGLRPKTIVSYELALSDLEKVFLKSYPISKISTEHINELRDKLLKQEKPSKKDTKEKKETLAHSTVNIRLRNIKAFLGWLVREKYLSTLPNVELLKVDKGNPKFLTSDELKSIYSKTDDQVLLATFRVYEGLGLRLGELKHSKLEGEHLKISAINAKGRKDRFVPMPEDLLEDYEIAMNSKYSTEYITKHFTILARKAGLEKGKTFHSLRHTFALRTLLQTNSIALVREALGHTDISTTMIYTNFPQDYLKSVLTERMIQPKLKALA
jgi:site-specific recombinase XerD